MKNKIKIGIVLLLYIILLFCCFSLIRYTHNNDFYFFLIISFMFNIILCIILDFNKKIIFFHIIFINIFFGNCIFICDNIGYWKMKDFGFVDIIEHFSFYTIEYFLCANWLIPIAYRYIRLFKYEKRII